jgi:hypothetical protein
MDEIIIRKATIHDIPFLVETIIEAEKAGTERLSYTTIFGLTEEESKKYLADMLLEEVDGCELSISSYIVAEKSNNLVAAVSAWVEGAEDIPSAMIKGNLLNYILPKKCLERAMHLNEMIRDLHIDYVPSSIQIGAGYVSKENRGNNLLGTLISEKIKSLSLVRPDISLVYDQMYECNIPAIKTDKKLNFSIQLIKKSSRKEIIQYLPSNKKILMMKKI